MTPSHAQAPSRTRWRILALLFAISVITYVDRVNISVTARQMMPALHLSDMQMGQIFSAFVVGYALFQIPGGWLGDRYGARIILAVAIVWWSLFTVLTAIAATLPLAQVLGVVGSLITVRWLVGVGEAAALPNFNRTVASWFGPRERGMGIGLAIGGIGVGAALTPPITAWIMVTLGWQTAFYVAGLCGLIIAALRFLYARDSPSEHAHVNAAELALVEGTDRDDRRRPAASVPWSGMLRTPSVWWLVLSYACLGYVAYVYMSWFYLYLVNVRGFGVLRGAFFSSGPFLAIAVFCPLGGWVTDRAVTGWGITAGRAVIGAAGMGLSALCILLGSLVDEPYAAIVLLSLGAGWLYFTVGAYWSSTMDLSKSHAGTLSGIMNTGANIGGSVSPTLTPWLAEHLGWPAALGAAALAAMVGGLMWLGIKPGDGLRRSSGSP
jgi:MFS transporter, ACS family, glucarate transporter